MFNNIKTKNHRIGFSSKKVKFVHIFTLSIITTKKSLCVNFIVITAVCRLKQFIKVCLQQRFGGIFMNPRTRTFKIIMLLFSWPFFSKGWSVSPHLFPLLSFPLLF